MRKAFLALTFAILAVPAFALEFFTVVVRGVRPSVIREHGGELITIDGSNFQSPVEIWVDSKQAFVVDVTSTQVRAVTPPTGDLGTRQSKAVKVEIISRAGTQLEERASASVTYVKNRLTPQVEAISPSAASPDGGTRVTIFGDGFESPVQVFFDDVEVQIIAVSLQSIAVIAPPHPAGKATIRIVNVLSGEQKTVPDAFDFVIEPTVVGISVPQGLFSGGTHVIIHGANFAPPLAVAVAGVFATVIDVTPTEVVAITGPAPADCADHTGPIVVTNIDTGTVAYGPNFTYITPRPYFASIPALTAGKPAAIVVGNSFGLSKFTIGSRSIVPDAAVENSNGTTTFKLLIPASECDGPPLVVPIAFTNPATGCTISDKVVIHPSRAGCQPSPPRRGGA